MAEFTQIPGVAANVSPQQATAATRAALWRIDHHGAEPADIRWALEALGLIEPAPVPVVEPVKRQQVTPEQDPVTKRWLKRTEETGVKRPESAAGVLPPTGRPDRPRTAVTRQLRRPE